MADVEGAVAAIRAGEAVILPTDTVYGLCASPDDERALARISDLKGRPEEMPVALLCANVDALLTSIPELEEPPLRALLPGPFTLVLPNPARRFRWLTGTRPETLGVRVPQLTGPAEQVLSEVETIAATSANLPGGDDPRTLHDVPEELRAAAEAVVDGGELPGTPSTVIDFTGAAPLVLREGAASAADALRVVSSVL